MNSIFGLLARRFRVIVFFVWVYTLIDLLQNGRYLTFLRPEFGIVLGIALALFFLMVMAEMARPDTRSIRWFHVPRPVILLLPLLFLLNAQGASLDNYTFKKRFTGTSGMSLNIEPSAGSDATDSGSTDKPGSPENVPSSLNPSPADRRVFSRKYEVDPELAAAGGQSPTPAPGTPEGPAGNTPPPDSASPGDGTRAAAGNPAPADVQDTPAPPSDDDDDRSNAREVTAVELYEAPKLWEGKQVAVIGMIDDNEDVRRKFGNKTRIVYRFLVSCCAADAQPVALLAEMKNTMKIQGSNVWVRVEGRFTLVKDEGRTVPILRDATLNTVPKPKNEYLF